MVNSSSKAFIIAIIAASIVFFYFLYHANSINVLLRFLFAVAILMAVGSIIKHTLDLKGGYGLYIIGGRKGLSTMNNISKKYRRFWDAMAMWGLTLGFGLLTYPLLKGRIDKRAYAFGMISLVFMMLFVLPLLSNGIQFINISQIQNAIARSPSSQQGPSIISYLIYAATVIGGFSGFIIVGLFASTETILWSVVRFISNPSLGTSGSGISSLVPGVAPIIPGIDIPLVAGIISLAILLIIHEFSHGILARIANVRLKSTGLLVFGFIPIGGYVEPDERMISRLDGIRQTKIFAAGVSANFIAAVIFALLLAITSFYILTAYQYRVIVTGTAPNYPANGILKSGMQILKWNNYTINNITTLAIAGSKDRPNQTVTILTNNGLYKFRAVPSPSNSSRGVIGVSLGYEPTALTPYDRFVYFIYTVFALSMLLNFFVGVINLLPIPGFDGWRIYAVNIRNKRFINFLGALIIILIIINILPWLAYV